MSAQPTLVVAKVQVVRSAAMDMDLHAQTEIGMGTDDTKDTRSSTSVSGNSVVVCESFGCDLLPSSSHTISTLAKSSTYMAMESPLVGH